MSKIYLQEKLVGAPGQVVGFDADGKAVVEDNIGQGGIGVNLHDNWYFRAPINQRGKTSYTTAGYTIDRWILSNPGQGITLGDDGITVRSTGAEWSQRMEGIAAYVGQPITLSMLLADGTLHTGTVATINWELETSQTAFDDDVMSCTITQIGTNICEVTYTMKAAGLVLVAAKMEMGTSQTLSRQDKNGNWVLLGTPPNYALEFLKCYRYQYCVNYMAGQAPSFSGYLSSDSTTVFFNVDLPIPFLMVPAVVCNNLTVTLRGVNGYPTIGSSIAPVTLPNLSKYYGLGAKEITVYHKFDKYIYSNGASSAGFNNTPISVSMRSGSILFDANL